MKGAAKRAENRRAEIWMQAYMPNMDKPVDFHEFVFGEKDNRAELLKCLASWDKIDAALARAH